VCLSSAAYEQVRDRVKEPFLDLGEKGLKNIARPVRVFGLGAAATAAVPESAIPPLQRTPVEATPAAPKSESAVRRESILTIFAGVAALLVAAGAVGPWTWREDKPVALSTGSPASTLQVAPGHPSIVVMPLANLSGDPAQDYFADGLTEDIISALGRFPDITVISRSAAFAYRGKSARPSEIGRELNVAYLVEDRSGPTSRPERL